MNKEELVALVKKIIAAAGTNQDENDALIELFEKSVPHPHAIDFIFSKEHEDLTPEEIVNKALDYRPFQL